MRHFNNYDLAGQPPVLAWNPIVMRCPGCGLDADPSYHPGRADKHCWHLRASDMGANNPKLPVWMREIKAGRRPAMLHGEELDAPARLRRPSVIATGFMGDPAWWGAIERTLVFDVMRDCPRHTFLLLTKWPERLAGVQFPDNVWVGVSVTNQADADLRIPALLRLLCRHRWVSVEPMLGQVVMDPCWISDCSCLEDEPPAPHAFVEFVACGHETGPWARPCAPDWICALFWQCYTASVPFYDKREPGAGQFCGTDRDWPQEWKAVNGTKGMTP